MSDLEKLIDSEVSKLSSRAESLLLDLVRCRSLQGNERSAQDLMEKLMNEIEMKVDRWNMQGQEELMKHERFSPVGWSYENADCVVGTYEGSDANAKSLIINGHIDVVPVEPTHLWKKDPFDPYVEDGWLYGRGSGDMKGGVIAAFIALLAIKNAGYRPKGRLHFETVPEEENSGNGALACCIKGYKADACIIPEPFGDVITVGQVGVMWLTVHLDGKPAHVLDTTAGINAIEGAYAIVSVLKEEFETMNSADKKHPAFKDITRPINVNLGIIQGGNWASSVPAYCKFDVRVGFYPDTDLKAMREKVEKIILEEAKKINMGCKIVWEGFQSEGYVADMKNALFEELAASFKRSTEREAQMNLLTCTTDARSFHLYYNTPATCLGPKAQRIHGVDECVEMKSVMEIAKTYAHFISKWCGLEKK